MTVLALNLTNSFTNSDDNFNTASVSPGANKLLLLTIASRSNVTADPPVPTITGNGLTWVLVDDVLYDDTSSSRKRLFLFRAMGASPSPGVITIDFGGQTQAATSWILDELDGIDTSGSDGSGAIVQSDVSANTGTGTGLTVTLAAFGHAGNATYTNFVVNAAVTVTQGSGFTVVDSALGSQTRSYTAFKSTPDTTVDWTNDSTAETGMIAVEIRAANVDISGSVDVTLAALTSTSAAVLNIAGSSSTMLAALTSSATATLNIAGQSGATLAALTTTAVGDLPDGSISGSVDVTLAALTSTSAAVLNIAGSSSKTLEVMTSNAVATLAIAASSNKTLAALTTISDAILQTVATANSTLAALTTSAQGILNLNGVTLTLLAPLTGVATAYVELPPEVVQGYRLSNHNRFSSSPRGRPANV